MDLSRRYKFRLYNVIYENYLYVLSCYLLKDNKIIDIIVIWLVASPNIVVEDNATWV